MSLEPTEEECTYIKILQYQVQVFSHSQLKMRLRHTL